MILRPVALAVACLAANLAHAQQEVADDSRANPQQLERVEVRSRALTDSEMRRRQPVAKQIYGREELDKYGDTQLSDVLKRLPGVNVSGGQLRMRGLGGAFTQILVNGDPAPPGFNLEQVNPAQVERIEVSKAPTADQSAQAIAGTVNIILKDAPRVLQRDLRLGLAYNHDRPVTNGSFTYGDRKGGLGVVLPISFFSWRLLNETETLRQGRDAQGQAQRLATDGWDVPYGHGFNMAPRVNWKLGDDETLTLQGFVVRNNFRNRGATVTEVEQGSTPVSVDDDFLTRGFFEHARVNLQYNNRFSDDQRIELKAGTGGARSRFDNQFHGRNAAGVQTVERQTLGSGKNRGFNLSGKYTQFVGESHTVTAGAELERRTREEERRTLENGLDLLPGVEGQPFDATVTRSALFVQDEWEIAPQWSAYLGLRNERIKTVSEGVGSTFRSNSSVLTPLFHLNYKFDPKARDLIRASLTRSYKAPDVQQLIARPTINTNYPTSGPNTETAPDRVGNPGLEPELATGFDLAFEKYLSGGSMFSVGVFHRRITGLIRNSLTLENQVSWAAGPRWVAKPVNLSRASTSGLELELKGRAGELMPSLFEPATALNLRGSLSVYHSKVKDITGPDNRLEQQQPWSMTLGWDYRFKGIPHSMGMSYTFTPSYEVQQTALSRLETGRARGLDAFFMMVLSPKDGLRFGIQNLAPVSNVTNTQFRNGDYNLTERRQRTWYSVNWEHRF
ncbi:iron complex outermembrane receptor protein [Inhella inkyongensis]|uniref:Iron complex outermembrane receptor protein n=1 Tax=Inhella inkyongensis TaxID=392593 RepID=A0A840S5B9_9BURK|nr:TonB-dependent receptor [Inhella inkyongensis]MBB5203700.1 iron complex outermembrane receptor protein [Inhella inkyongensis]